MDLAALDHAIDLMRRKGVRVLVAGDVRIELGPDPTDVTVRPSLEPDLDAEAKRKQRERERHESILFRSAP